MARNRDGNFMQATIADVSVGYNDGLFAAVVTERVDWSKIVMEQKKFKKMIFFFIIL